MSNERIKAIRDAATNLFLQQGYSKTQISHIAKAVGVSVGTIYLDFAGKREIMQFMLKSTIDPDFADREFKRPITNDIFSGLEKEVADLFEREEAEFAKHLENDATGYGFEELISNAFDLMAKYAASCLFIEKNQFDFKFLAEQYKTHRTRFFNVMSQYLRLFVQQGTIRPIEQLELTTMLIVELLSWWAMDMRYISFEINNIPLEQAKKVCMDNLIAAYGV